MSIKEMNQKISDSVYLINKYLDRPCTAEEMLNAMKAMCISEEIAKQIKFNRGE